METPTPSGPDCFDRLIAQLRTEGHDEAAERLHFVRHQLVCTTGTELWGELGLALREFTRTRPKLSRDLRRLVRECRCEVGRVWPGLRWWWAR